MWNCLRDVFIYSQHTWKENQNRAETYSWGKTRVRNFLMWGWRSDKLIKSAGKADYGLSQPSSCEAPPSPLQWFYHWPKPPAGWKRNPLGPASAPLLDAIRPGQLGASVVLMRSCLTWPLLMGCKGKGNQGCCADLTHAPSWKITAEPKWKKQQMLPEY